MSNLGNAQDFGCKFGNYRKTPFNPKPGTKFGEWTVISKEPNYGYRVECSCGVVTTVKGSRLKNKLSLKCSMCAMRDRRRDRHEKGFMFNGPSSKEIK